MPANESQPRFSRLAFWGLLVAIALGTLLVIEPSSTEPADATAEAIAGSVADNIRKAVGAGNFHWCAIDSNNGVKCWGELANSNTWGQLGQGNTNSYTGPQTVLGLSSGVAQIAVGNTHSCAVMAADGLVKCWGRNYEGALGNGVASTGNASATPTNVITTANVDLTGVSDIATFDDHTCAVKSGAVWCWGYNIGGMGITGNTSNTLLKATQILASGAVSVAVGNDSSCALMTDKTVKCWGTGGKGQMGNAGALSYNNPPTTVSGLSNVVALSVGLGTACALTEDGNVSCWGNNLFGVVANGLCGFGSGSGEKADVPTGPVNSYIGVAAGERVIALSLSYSEGIALTDTGRSIKWGGDTGPCRAGSTWAQSLPTGVNVVAISSSGTSLGQSCYVRSDRVIVCNGSMVTGVTPAGASVPDTPGTPTVTVGDGQATITITPAGTGVSPSTYTVTASPGAATCMVTPPATSCSISGLTNGTAYTFTSTADNTFGSSSPSPASAPKTPNAVPDTPGPPTVTVGDGQTTITVTPAGTGGTPSTYTVTANPGGATCTVTPPATSCTISGLTNGTAYTFSSTATNDAGTSAASPSSTPKTPNMVPDVPGAPTVIVDDGQATITVTSAGTGGTPSTYTVTANPGGATCTVTPPATSCTISGLTNGTAYTFSSIATNDAGSSSASPSSSPKTPNAVPHSPGEPTVTVGDGQATITVTPAGAGGTPTTYTVTANPGGATCTVAAPATSCKITGLTNGTSYTFTVVATNDAGSSQTSTASKATKVGAVTASTDADNGGSNKGTQSSTDSATTASPSASSKAGSSPTALAPLARGATSVPVTGSSSDAWFPAILSLLFGAFLLLGRSRLRRRPTLHS